MKMSMALEITDDVRKGLRAAAYRGGYATRQECKAWILALVAKAAAELPEPRGRRKVAEPAAAPSRQPVAQLMRAAAEAPDDATCGGCGRPKHQHGKMGYSCPPVQGVARGRVFTARRSASGPKQQQQVEV